MLSGHESAVQDALRGRKGLRVRVLGALPERPAGAARKRRAAHPYGGSERGLAERDFSRTGGCCVRESRASSIEPGTEDERSLREASFRLLRTRLSSACMAT